MTYQSINTTEVCETVENALTFNALSFNRRELLKSSTVKDYLVYSLPDFNTAINKDDVTPTLRIINSHDGSRAFRIMLGMVRWVCTNGLSSGDFLYSQRIVHTAGSTLNNKLEELPGMIQHSIDLLASGEVIEELTELSNHSISTDKAIQIIGNLPIPISAKHQSIYRLYKPRRIEDTEKTLWCLWNNVNESIKDINHNKIGGASENQSAINQNDNLLQDILLLAA